VNEYIGRPSHWIFSSRTDWLIIGYFAGREHLKYEMRSAIQSATAEIQRGFASNFGSNPSASGSEKRKPPSASKPKEPEPLEIALLTKGFKPSNPTARDYEDEITFTLSVRNTGSEDIRAFDGTLNFTDLLDNQIMSLSLAINDPVGSAAMLTWKGALKYNQFIEQHQHLRNAQQGNIKISFIPKRILFADGRTKEYNNR
jgi:uncharacterized repeat protein (TIGR01451 family)